MTLPNYFLADLPPEAWPGASMVRDACIAIKRNREHYLSKWTTPALVRLLSSVAEDWLDEKGPYRKIALEESPAQTGFSPHVLALGLDTFFSQLTYDNLDGLILQELGHVERLDSFVFTPVEQRNGRVALARGPALLAHLATGHLPTPALLNMVLGLLCRSAQFVKCAVGTSLLPRLFAHSVYEVEPKIGACLEIAEWPGANSEIEDALFAEADCVTATGPEETLDILRRRMPGHVRFLGSGHQASFGYVTREMLSRHAAPEVVSHAAADVVAWDQLGCLSPHVFYVEKEGTVGPERFAEMLAESLGHQERVRPRGPLSAADAAAIASRRAFYEVRAAHSPDTLQWCSDGSTAWTVVFESDPQFQVSCLNRFIYVKAVQNLAEALQGAERVRGKVSTIGLAAPASLSEKLITELARWGATRICRLGQMQNPPLAWRHDGRPSLGDLVTWTDWER